MLNLSRVRFSEFEINPVHQYSLLGMITLIAALLRFYKLGEWSFWWDEMFTLRDVQNIFDNFGVRTSLSFMLINVVLNALGISEWSARLVPAIFGILSVPILYFPVKKMFGPAVALITGSLLALSPWHLYWSQNARFYTALLLFYTLALLTFYFWIEEDRLGYLLLTMIL